MQVYSERYMAHEYAIERTSLDLDVTRSDMYMYVHVCQNLCLVIADFAS